MSCQKKDTAKIHNSYQICYWLTDDEQRKQIWQKVQHCAAVCYQFHSYS